LIQQGEIDSSVFLSPVAAISVGIVNGKPLLDLCYKEDHQADVDANIVMNADGKFIEIQITAENKPFTPAMLDSMISLAQKGITQLIIEGENILRTNKNSD
jgi:ribonuclease PH